MIERSITNKHKLRRQLERNENIRKLVTQAQNAGITRSTAIFNNTNNNNSSNNKNSNNTKTTLTAQHQYKSALLPTLNFFFIVGLVVCVRFACLCSCLSHPIGFCGAYAKCFHFQATMSIYLNLISFTYNLAVVSFALVDRLGSTYY
uniref:Uncharacterized protein n=1 Tax=Glossina brevipalpis TaxID=37001 RepID=A0A1A9WQ20_9MUSC